jgi:hypothetical protein
LLPKKPFKRNVERCFLEQEEIEKKFIFVKMFYEARRFFIIQGGHIKFFNMLSLNIKGPQNERVT